MLREIVELKVELSKMESATLGNRVAGIVFLRMLLLRRSEAIVTDRLLVSEEGVRVLDLRE